MSTKPAAAKFFALDAILEYMAAENEYDVAEINDQPTFEAVAAVIRESKNRVATYFLERARITPSLLLTALESKTSDGSPVSFSRVPAFLARLWRDAMPLISANVIKSQFHNIVFSGESAFTFLRTMHHWHPRVTTQITLQRIREIICSNMYDSARRPRRLSPKLVERAHDTDVPLTFPWYDRNMPTFEHWGFVALAYRLPGVAEALNARLDTILGNHFGIIHITHIACYTNDTQLFDVIAARDVLRLEHTMGNIITRVPVSPEFARHVVEYVERTGSNEAWLSLPCIVETVLQTAVVPVTWPTNSTQSVQRAVILLANPQFLTMIPLITVVPWTSNVDWPIDFIVAIMLRIDPSVREVWDKFIAYHLIYLGVALPHTAIDSAKWIRVDATNIFLRDKLEVDKNRLVGIPPVLIEAVIERFIANSYVNNAIATVICQSAMAVTPAIAKTIMNDHQSVLIKHVATCRVFDFLSATSRSEETVPVYAILKKEWISRGHDQAARDIMESMALGNIYTFWFAPYIPHPPGMPGISRNLVHIMMRGRDNGNAAALIQEARVIISTRLLGSRKRVRANEEQQ